VQTQASEETGGFTIQGPIGGAYHGTQVTQLVLLCESVQTGLLGGQIGHQIAQRGVRPVDEAFCGNSESQGEASAVLGQIVCRMGLGVHPGTDRAAQQGYRIGYGQDIQR